MDEAAVLFIKIVKFHMNRRGISKTVLAEKAGCPTSIVSRLLGRGYEVSDNCLCRICDALELSPLCTYELRAIMIRRRAKSRYDHVMEELARLSKQYEEVTKNG